MTRAAETAPIIIETAARSVRARRRIRGLIHETPVIASRSIGAAYGAQLLFKAENLQLTGSFKLRGALSKMTSIVADQGLITASSGNHGIASAQAAQLLGKRLAVVLPETVTERKLRTIRSFGVEVVLHGEETSQAEERARIEASTRGLVYMSPYNDHEVVAGQGTIGLELLDQLPAIDNVFVSMGGGGLIGGIAAVLKSFSPTTRIIGVAAENSAALAAALDAGKVVDVPHLPTLADGVSGGIDDGTITLPLVSAAIDEVVTCSEREIEAATVDLLLKENLVAEGAAGLALAGYLQMHDRCRDAVNVVVLCGGNIDVHTILGLIGSR
jgi:threonine dehydratase